MTPENLKNAASYDPETGDFVWLLTKGRCRQGEVCGWINNRGYRCMKFGGVETTVGRFAWFYVHGAWPDGELEYLNGDPLDTRISNLVVRQSEIIDHLSAGRLRELIHYDPETGKFIRSYKTKRNGLGTVTGAKHGTTYARMKITIGGRVYMAHRLAWLFVHGKWPHQDIDHIDGDACNNRIANLRLATDSQNLGNMKKPCTNKSGKKGVSWHAAGKKWQAHIKVDGVNKYLGLFDTVDAAHSAYCQEAVRSRGEFARFE